MEVRVLDMKGEERGGKVGVNDGVLGIEGKDEVVYVEVKEYVGKEGEGRGKCKERREMRGCSGKVGGEKGGGGGGGGGDGEGGEGGGEGEGMMGDVEIVGVGVGWGWEWGW